MSSGLTHATLTRIVLIGIACVAVQRFCHHQTRGFTLLKIASSEDASKPPVAVDAEIEHMLDQPYTFMSSGGQCYAFVSQDQKYVLKFFKQHHIRMWKWLNRLPLPNHLRKKLLDEKTHQSPQFFESCTIAYEEFKERSGLIYLHLHRTAHFKKKLRIVDPLGITHTIDLDQTDFALQWRAELCYRTLKTLIRENRLEAAKQCIDSILALIEERAGKGIVDRDFNMRTNIGFLGTYAIEIDLGSFSKGPPVPETTRKFHTWLSKHSGELAAYLNERTQSNL